MFYFSGDRFQLMFRACTCIQMARGQAAPRICPRLLSAKYQAVSSQQARKSQGLLGGRDHHALSWPEAAGQPAPLRAVVPAREWPLGGIQGTWELLGQSVAVWGREVGRHLPLGTEPHPRPCQAWVWFPTACQSQGPRGGAGALTASLCGVLAVVQEAAWAGLQSRGRALPKPCCLPG